MKIDWVAVTAALIIIGLGIVYAVFGTSDDGFGALLNSIDPKDFVGSGDSGSSSDWPGPRLE